MMRNTLVGARLLSLPPAYRSNFTPVRKCPSDINRTYATKEKKNFRRRHFSGGIRTHSPEEKAQLQLNKDRSLHERDTVVQ